MDYSTLTTNIQDICEDTFEASQLSMFVQQAEQKIYETVDLPVLRKNQTAALTASNSYLTVPSDFISAYSLAVVDGSGAYEYLVNKDVNFIREAYPIPSSTGQPKYYAYLDKDTFILGPTPDSGYTVELHYKHFPESIVTASTTWLGDNFDNVLLNGALLEALRFMKGEPDLVEFYNNLYLQSIQLLKQLGEGRLRQDTYRSGQNRVLVG